MRLERAPGSPPVFINKTLPVGFIGTKIELRGFLRTQDVDGFAGLWIHLEGESSRVASENMEQRQLKGTTDWAQYSISVPVDPGAKQLAFGVELSGSGKAWADDLQLLVDGKPIWEAPSLQTKTILSSDHEFDRGSGIALKDLTPIQIENLVMLGKVWGFLKYHHPKIVAGQFHWDYELFRVLPAVLGATNRSASNTALNKWIAGLGPVDPCKMCATLEERDLLIRPDLDWLSDETLLGADLGRSLREIYRNRSASGKQFFVSRDSNPNLTRSTFDQELAYRDINLPDAGFQLLALYRFWNIVEYWYPDRDLIGEDWDAVMKQFIPRITLSESTHQFQLELLALIAKVHDTHSQTIDAFQVQPPSGACQLPVRVRFVENQAVVTEYSESNLGPASGLRVGDVLIDLDGIPMRDLVERWSPYYPASNDAARLRDIAIFMTRGECGKTFVGVGRGTETLRIAAERTRIPQADAPRSSTHDLPGETFRLLSDEVAYLKLSSVEGRQAESYVERATGTKGIIIDIRNYPNTRVDSSLASLLIDKEKAPGRSSLADLSNPGAFHEVTLGSSLKPRLPHYAGKVVILVDEATQSLAEGHATVFRAAPGAIVVGSTTAGADGDTAAIPLPGLPLARITGERAPEQRIGVIPDVDVKPTIGGIRAGRDEVLEEAIRQILGPDAPSSQIERMAKP